ncbi:hypothetical protein SAMN05421747_101559 [Parapedobacter composti]|uniref:Uncharacterized protein n=1 Tax=Parapedobacter composti TaxID=623281 RepID=A0A1I1EFU9_9SPHI|nr:hypothetical protein SAMN05421747_101559 [Parapedobacter composti]
MPGSSENGAKPVQCCFCHHPTWQGIEYFYDKLHMSPIYRNIAINLYNNGDYQDRNIQRETK